MYQDIGTREITKWLQQAPMGKVKVLFIENMERMNKTIDWSRVESILMSHYTIGTGNKSGNIGQ